ncbi:hypothetical protein EW146_g9351 [Bondarzewia mesenterica]|uniref:Enoyl reductase (ER) domain-containing protein n=1 Tax=Bondarzewia mesenterica TaxID=1095465 RepID=A0A4S4L7H3_9AGAM|nr:hypothetical protein EW146_g9351 [Bondarzewia mesenterica]
MPQTYTAFHLVETKGPSGLSKSDQEVIPVPRAHEVLVRIHAVSLNFRDLVISRGQYGMGTKKDVVPCSDMAGEVVSVGEGVREFKQGDRVVALFDQYHLYGPGESMNGALGAPIDGVLQEYRVFDAVGLLNFPEHLTYEEAACWPCAGVTAWNALFGGIPLTPGQTVLIQGTGGVSMLGLILANAAGAKALRMSSTTRNTPTGKKVAMQLTNGRGAHYIIDNVGTTGLEKCFNCSAQGGIINAIGFLGGEGNEKYPNVSLLAIFKNTTLRGINVGSKQLFQDLLRFVEVQQLRPHIDKVFPFEQTLEAFEYFAGRGHIGKVVIRVSPQ